MGSRLGMMAALLVALGGCDRADDGESSAGQRRAERKAAADATPANDPLADMVSAVTSARQSAPVELKFSIERRPEVGKPIEVRVAVLPVSVLTRIAANFQASPGLDIRYGDAMAAVEEPKPGVPLSHRLIVVPQRDGIFFVSAVVHADSAEQSLTRTFSIPIIAAEGQPPARASSEERTGDSKPR